MGCAKLVANAFLAQRFSSINSISALCEATGANVGEISRAVGKDDRIGKRFLQASIGFGGSCFQKDILNLVYLCETYGLTECAEYWNQVIVMNNYQKKRFSEKMVSKMLNTVTGKKIEIFVYDPQVKREDMWSEMDYTCGVNISNTPNLHEAVITSQCPYEAAKDAHAIAILTEWDEFKAYDYEKIYKSMAKPAFLFDGRNILDHDALRKIGFEVHGIGSPDPLKFMDL